MQEQCRLPVGCSDPCCSEKNVDTPPPPQQFRFLPSWLSGHVTGRQSSDWQPRQCLLLPPFHSQFLSLCHRTTHCRLISSALRCILAAHLWLLQLQCKPLWALSAFNYKILWTGRFGTKLYSLQSNVFMLKVSKSYGHVSEVSTRFNSWMAAQRHN